VHVEGSYSCFKGDEERRLFLKAGRLGVKFGVLEPFKVTGVAGLGDRCGGGAGASSTSAPCVSASSLGSRCLRVLADADAGCSRGPFISAEALTGVVGPLVFRDRGMLGSSIDGTDDTLL
jgi:hypothetical protein